MAEVADCFEVFVKDLASSRNFADHVRLKTKVPQFENSI